jgi:hypothetical protein
VTWRRRRGGDRRHQRRHQTLGRDNHSGCAPDRARHSCGASDVEHLGAQLARIFECQFRKLLVLSDTRSIYTPLFSGVLWDVQDYLLQDVDCIEIIRGPGATLWGSNAVNGVINITTKSAKDTQGLYAETSGGTEEHAAVAARYGGHRYDEPGG